MHVFDYSHFLTGDKLLACAAKHVLDDNDGKSVVFDHALAIGKTFSLCCMLDEAKAVREEVAFFQAVKVITKREIRIKKKTDNNASWRLTSPTRAQV